MLYMVYRMYPDVLFIYPVDAASIPKAAAAVVVE